MKKSMLLIFSVLLVFASLVACSSKDSSTASTPNSSENNGKVTLTFLDRWPNEPYKTYFNQVISEFQKQNPNIKVNVISALNDDYKQKVNVLLGNNNPPDIFFSWVGEYGEKFIRDGKALDITDYVNKDADWSKQIINSQFKAFSVDNKVYGVPLYMDSKVFFYNKDIFDKLNLKAPTNWSEFMNALKVIKEHNMTPIMFGNKGPWAAGHYITALNQRMVSQDVIAKDNQFGKSEFKDPGYAEALKKFSELIPYMNQDPNAIAHDEARNYFLGGKAAIMYLETMETTYMKNATFKWDTFAFPAIEGGKGDPKGMIGAPEGFMISKSTKHPAEAVKFLEFLTSKPMAEKLVKDTGMPSVVKGAINDQTASAKEVEEAKMIEDRGDMAIWLDTALDGRIFKPYLAGAQQLLNKQETPEDVMKQVQDAAQQVK